MNIEADDIKVTMHININRHGNTVFKGCKSLHGCMSIQMEITTTAVINTDSLICRRSNDIDLERIMNTKPFMGKKV